MDFTARNHPCPGKEPEYAKKHGISGAALFFAIILPVAAASGVGYWVWKNWDGKFGRIRLGDSGFGGATGNMLDGDSPMVKWPIAALSGVVAVLAALPSVVGAIYRAVSSRLGSSRGASAYSRPYTSRASFQRGRDGYAVVDEDELSLIHI